MKRDNFAFLIDQKLGEVPGNLLRLALLTVIELTLAAQEAIEFTCLLAINILLCQDWALEIFVKGELTNICRSAGLLATELIARYGNYFETLLIKLPMQLNHLFVVQIS